MANENGNICARIAGVQVAEYHCSDDGEVLVVRKHDELESGDRWRPWSDSNQSRILLEGLCRAGFRIHPFFTVGIEYKAWPPGSESALCMLNDGTGEILATGRGVNITLAIFGAAINFNAQLEKDDQK